MLEAGRTGFLHYGADGERRGDELAVFVQSFAPPPRMLVFGAIDFAAAVARVGRFLGFYVTVCDARPVFATTKRFPEADEVVVRWPHEYLAETEVDERTVICVLTHDPKFDVPLLEAALRTPAAYIGAMGSRRTHEDRLARLREAGLTDAELARLASPIGLDIGARTPEETAVSIAAEIVSAHWGGTGRPADGRRGPDPPRRGPMTAAGERGARAHARRSAAFGAGGRRRAGRRCGDQVRRSEGAGRARRRAAGRPGRAGRCAPAGCDPVVVVLGAAVVDVPGADVVVVNEQWATGMGSSLRAALAAPELAGCSAAVAGARRPAGHPCHRRTRGGGRAPCRRRPGGRGVPGRHRAPGAARPGALGRGRRRR